MKLFFILITFLVLNIDTIAQATKQDLTKAASSPDRKAILAALKLALEPGLRLKPSFIVRSLMVKNNFAFFLGAVKNGLGKDINFRKTEYKEAVEAGMFDGDGTTALLKKKGGKWKVLQFTVGPTDVPWGCWWKEFKAPKEIFSYVEKQCEQVEK